MNDKVKTIFVIFWSKDGKWISTSDENFVAHVNYMTQIHKEGKAYLGGPFSDESGSMILLNVKDKKEAEEIVAGSPAYKSGAIKAEIKEMTLFYVSREMERVV
jgi:uncharacterized protein YciI